MSRYSIYIEKEDKKDRTMLKLYHNNKLETKFDLEVIDKYLTQFKDQDEFLTKMAKIDALPFIPKKCFIGYTMNGKVLEKNIIYNNRTIYNAAKSTIEQKNQGLNYKKLVLPQTSDINNFVNTIKDLAINNNEAFKSMFFSQLFPKHIYDLFKQYRNIKKNNYISKDDQNDLNELSEQISYNIRKYKYFRAIYLWKNKFEKKQIEKKENTKEYNQIELSSFINMDTNQINNKPYTFEDYEVSNDDIDNNINERNINDEQYDNIKNIFDNYGIEGVMNYYDIDDLNRYLTDDQAKKMGLK